MSKLSQQEERELISFIKDWLKSHGFNQKDLANELNIKSSRTSEIILKIKELYKKGGMFNIAKNLIKILIKAGRTIAKPALEVLEMAIDPFTPAQVRVSLMAALAYLIMPFDLFPDFMPLVGFSDDFVALTAVLSIWSKYMTPSIRARAANKLNKLFPFY